jgi:NAD+ kinase
MKGQIGVLYNARLSEAAGLAGEVAAWLVARGFEAWVADSGEATAGPERLAGLRLLVVLGGDGTTLLAARLTAASAVPIFGVNFGRVGFLSEAEPENWPERLARVLDGDCRLERRLMLEAQVRRGEERIGELLALNDVVVSRGVQVRMVRFHLYVDGDHVTTYSADGLIAATPTGSTAYSMAAGGPLLPPQLQNFLVLPVAPHLSFERPLVLHQEAEIRIRVEMDTEAIVSADGQDAFALHSGDEVDIHKYRHESCFARVDRPSYFYHKLMQRLSFWSLKQ